MKLIALLLIGVLLGTSIFSFAQIIHVPGDHSTVQEGINAATNGDTVLVADGTYLENIRFMGKAITVASHFIVDGDTNHINNTILDGSQPSNPDEASVVSFINGEDTTSIICGFTITGGTGMIDPKYGARIGGGIVSRYASAKIIHNKITGNEVTSATNAWGGGVNCFMDTSDYWAILENNTISGNHSNAGTGWAEGGGVEISSNARIENNTIVNNHCTSITGDADGGGVFHMSVNAVKSITIRNNQISNNTLVSAGLSRGGGVSVWFSECQVFNNTICNNTSTGSITNGAGLFIRESYTANIKGNIIKENTVYTSNEFWGPGCMIYRPLGSVYFEDNRFLDNEGPNSVYIGSGGGLAILNAENNLILVKGNVFNGNQGNGGGGFYSRSCYNLTVTNNYFTENESIEGGAVKMYIPTSTSDMRPVFTNNTFLSNIAENRGGGAHLNCESNIPVFFNNIFYNNNAPTGSELSLAGNPQPLIISYSCIDPVNISGTWTGTDNINEDPLIILLDTLGHLSSTSPCINTGVSSLLVGSNTYFAPDVDIDWEPRPDMYGGFDMGSDEYWELPTVPIALNPIEQGSDSFVAVWQSSEWSTGYYLDVAIDSNFTSFLSGYENLDVGSDTSHSVEGLSPGTYYYRVRAYSPIGISDYSNIIDVDILTGMDDPGVIDPTHYIQIYPNPVNSTLYIKSGIAHHGHIEIHIINTLSTCLKSWQFTNQADTEQEFRLNVFDLPTGIFFVRVQTDNKNYVTKVIKR